jgi:N-carbamoylputrescine amidase
LTGPNGSDLDFGGMGWIIEPQAGGVLGTTSGQEPFITMELDLRLAECAKATYPRYVLD